MLCAALVFQPNAERTARLASASAQQLIFVQPSASRSPSVRNLATSVVKNTPAAFITCQISRFVQMKRQRRGGTRGPVLQCRLT